MRDNIIQNLNEIFQAKARLGIMTVLTSMGDSDFLTIKDQLGLTDGNLSAHLRVLEEAGYIQLEKKFVKRKPKTLCRLTPSGREAFLHYLKQLEQIIQLARKEEK
ncbi:MAG TPA: transcriptional regulator [Firmicutes bacterium]|jgi:DNA-binding MarR family transcriptional regulator|nr:transcriptional regulator [Bacillota bacterium]